MPKRTYEEKVEYYKRKLDKIRNKHCRKRRRLEDSTSSSGQDNQQGLYRWNTEMVLSLFDTYVERDNKFSSGKYSQKKIWEEIAEVIRAKIPNITGPQCASKLKSLKKMYKMLRTTITKVAMTGECGNFMKKWAQFLIKKAWASPVAVASSSGISSITNQDKRSSDSSSNNKSKESVASLLTKRIRQKEEEVAHAKRHKERMEMDREIPYYTE